MIEFLTPVNKQIVAHREILPDGVLGKSIDIHQASGELPDLKGVDFALIGVAEQRNDIDYIDWRTDWSIGAVSVAWIPCSNLCDNAHKSCPQIFLFSATEMCIVLNA